MTSTRANKRLYPAVCLVAGGVLLGAAFFFYWQSLADVSTPISFAIPASELESEGPHSVSWGLPAEVRSLRWARTGVRLWEADRPLLRSVSPTLVGAPGAGRFCVSGEQVFFSASDDSSPSRNGRKYRLEVLRPSHSTAVWAGICMLLAALMLLLLPWRAWTQALFTWLSIAPHRQNAGRWAALFLVAWAGFLMLQRHQPWTLHRRVPVPHASLIYNADGVAAYHLPKWIAAHPYRWESATLLANGTPLTRVRPEGLKTGSDAWGYAVSNEAVSFRPESPKDAPGEATGYRLDVVLFGFAFFEPAACSWWAMLLLGLAVLAWQGSNSGARARCPQRAGPGALAWWGSIILVALCKLWLVSGDEVIGQVADSLNYAHAAGDLVWFGSSELPTHPSGFSFIAALCAQLGVPWRLGLELLYLASCGLCACSVRALTGSRVAGFLLYFFLAWHPWPLSGFREFMSDPLVLVLQLALVGSLLMLLRKPVTDWRWSQLALLGLLLWLWQWSRYEEALLALCYGVFVVFALFLARPCRSATALRFWPTAARVLFPMMVVGVLALGVRFANTERFGVRAKSLIDAPGLTALMKALYRVQPSQTLRYAPVTKESLNAACDASPSLAPFRSRFFDTNLAPTQLGEAITKQPAEFGPYLLWLLPQQVLPNDRRAANRTLLQAAREIEAALHDGRLHRRNAFYPLDPNWRLWVPDLPGSIAARLREGTSCQPPGEPWGTYQGALVQHTFDVGATRRAAHTYTNLFLLEGVVLSRPDALDSVAVADAAGRWLGATTLAASNWWEHGQAFDIQVPVQDEAGVYLVTFFKEGRSKHRASLELTPAQATTDGTFSCVAELRRAGVPLSTSLDDFSFYLHAGIAHSPRAERRAAWERMLGAYYPQALHCGLIVAVLVLLIGSKPLGAGTGERGAPEACLTDSSAPRANRLLLFSFLLALSWLVARAAFYGLVEANMGWGVVRYMRCVSPLFILVLFLAAAWGGSCLAEVRLYFVRVRTKIVCPWKQFC